MIIFTNNDIRGPLNKLDAGDYAELSTNVKLFNKATLESYPNLYIKLHLPQTHCTMADVERIISINNTTSNKIEKVELDMSDILVDRSWVIIPMSLLDTSIGNHTVQIVVKYIWTPNRSICYASYIIQDDNPDKPYVYLNTPQDDENDNEDTSNDVSQSIQED